MFFPCSTKRRASDKDLPVFIDLCIEKVSLVTYYLANNHENADIKKESASAAAPMFFA